MRTKRNKIEFKEIGSNLINPVKGFNGCPPELDSYVPGCEVPCGNACWIDECRQKCIDGPDSEWANYDHDFHTFWHYYYFLI